MQDYPPLTKKEMLILDLQDAQGHIRQGWCVGANAVDKNENIVNPTCPTAEKFCLIGAIDKSAGQIDEKKDLMFRMINEALNLDCAISEYNDAQIKTQEEAAAVFDKTIEYVRTQIGDDLSYLRVYTP